MFGRKKQYAGAKLFVAPESWDKYIVYSWRSTVDAQTYNFRGYRCSSGDVVWEADFQSHKGPQTLHIILSLEEFAAEVEAGRLIRITTVECPHCHRNF